MEKYMKMQFKANIGNVSLARAVTTCFLVDSDLTISTLNEIKTIVSEAVTNAIVHGYHEDNVSIVSITLSLTEDLLTIIISDDGVGIEDIDKARAPLFSTKLGEERAGLGFTIMEVFSDELYVDSTFGKGTTVSCIKKIA